MLPFLKHILFCAGLEPKLSFQHWRFDYFGQCSVQLLGSESEGALNGIHDWHVARPRAIYQL